MYVICKYEDASKRKIEKYITKISLSLKIKWH